MVSRRRCDGIEVAKHEPLPLEPPSELLPKPPSSEPVAQAIDRAVIRARLLSKLLSMSLPPELQSEPPPSPNQVKGRDVVGEHAR